MSVIEVPFNVVAVVDRGRAVLDVVCCHQSKWKLWEVQMEVAIEDYE
jgi:hypothetical protein